MTLWLHTLKTSVILVTLFFISDSNDYNYQNYTAMSWLLRLKNEKMRFPISSTPLDILIPGNVMSTSVLAESFTYNAQFDIRNSKYDRARSFKEVTVILVNIPALRFGND